MDKEFDPTEFPPEYITVEGHEGIQSILVKVEDALERSPNVVLVIPRGAQAFHTTHDFLALGKIQQLAGEVRISIASLDPTIAGLGRVLGFHVEDPPADHPVTTSDPALGTAHTATGDLEKATAPLPLPPSGEVPEWIIAETKPSHRTGNLTTSTWLNHPGDGSDASHAQGKHPSQPLSRPGVPPPRTRPRQTGQLLSTMLTDDSLPSIVTPAPGQMKARVIVSDGSYAEGRGIRYGGLRKPARWGRTLALFAALLVLTLAAGSAYAYVYLPEGTVAVTPLNRSIGDLTVNIDVLTTGATGSGGTTGLAMPGAGDSIDAPSISAVPLQGTITEEGTHPATGSREVPSGRAQGTMRFTNRTGGAVSVPASAQFKAPNGVTVQTTQGGTVAATVFGQSFGTLDLPVEATVEGPGGNIGPGLLSGVYNGVLNYTNSALQGGSTRTIKVVRQEDIDSMVAELRARAEGRVGGVVAELKPAGTQLITQTVQLADVRFESDLIAGWDGEAVKVKLTAQARAFAFSENDVREAVEQAVFDWVSANVPSTAGPNTDQNSIQYTPPVVQSVQDGRVVYTTSASARVTYSLTPDLSRQIRDLVKGKTTRQARNLITESYGRYVNAGNVQARVLWFNIDKLPSDPARIDVESSTAPGLYTPDTTPDSPSLPDPRSTEP